MERWITQTGRAPYARHRHAVAAQVHENESYLWPDAVPADRATRISQSEVIEFFPQRASVPATLWQRLFTSATKNIDILAYAGLFLPEQQPKMIRSLRDKAAAGTAIRILLGDPDSPQVLERSRDEGIGDALSAKIRNVLSFYAPLRGVSGVAVNLHTTTLYNSIYRFDDEMLINTHVYGYPAAHAPMLHVRRLAGGDLFETYTDSYDRVWATSASAWPEGTRD
jgi:hypothetical protein